MPTALPICLIGTNHRILEGTLLECPSANLRTHMSPAQQKETRFGPWAGALQAGNAVAFLSSLVFHIGLLLLLALCVYSAGKPSHGLLLDADIGESESVALDLVQTFDIEPQMEQPHSAHAVTEVSLDVELDNLLQQPALETSQLHNNLLASVSMNDVTEKLSRQGSGRGASFFGSYAHGDRFVFVLDSSRSMKGDRWTYACNQLIDSLNALKPGQEFFVICFDMETSFLFNAKPDRITFSVIDDMVVSRVRNWLRSRTLGRATMPAEALRYALDLNPDAVFLLSDGELQDDSLLMLRLLNGSHGSSRQIPIHTINLFSQEGRFTLQQIALENGGSFTPIAGR